MTSLLAEMAHSILREALADPIGIAVGIESPEPIIAPVLRAKQILYRFKQDNSDFAILQIRFSPDDPEGELWIVKDNNLAAAEE